MWAADFLPAIEQVRAVHTCQSVPNVFINLRILAIVPNYMSVFAHQKPIYLLPSVNIPVKAVIIIRLSKIHLFFF